MSKPEIGASTFAWMAYADELGAEIERLRDECRLSGELLDAQGRIADQQEAELRAEVERLRAIVKTSRDMRSCQRRYFKDRTASALNESKRLEKELDRLLADTEQLSLPD